MDNLLLALLVFGPAIVIVLVLFVLDGAAKRMIDRHGMGRNLEEQAAALAILAHPMMIAVRERPPDAPPPPDATEE